MAYNSLGIANALLKLAWDRGKTIDPLQLQKMLYFAHGWHWALKGEPLLDEYIEAWDYGPVAPNVYHSFKGFGSSAITRLARHFDEHERFVPVPLPDDEFVLALLDQILTIYGEHPGLDLVKMTHTVNSPWTVTRLKSEDRHGKDIPEELIAEYFKGLMTSGNK